MSQPEPDSFKEAYAPSSEVTSFKRIAIPLIRRIYPQLIADQLVGVQPLAFPAESASVQDEWKPKEKCHRSIDDPWSPSNVY